MSTEDGRFSDDPAGAVRVADFDALDDSDDPGDGVPVVRVASFDLDGGDGDGDPPGRGPGTGIAMASAPTSGLRTVDLDGGRDAEEPPRIRVASFDDALDDAGSDSAGPDSTGSDSAGSGGTARQARFDGTPPTDRPRSRDRAGRRDGTGRPDRNDRPRRARGGRSADGPDAGRAGKRADAGPAPDDETRAKEICLRLLTDRARTVKELRDALVRKEIPERVADRVLARFDEVGLVDDEAFAGQWVRSRHRHRGLGRRAIAQELRRKGVAKEVADEALTEIDAESEEARARELVAKKIRTVKVGTREERASASRRLVGMLARKGYGAGVAYSVVREAIAARGAEEDEMGEEPPED